MATLLDSLEVKQIAFAWGGTTRVFRNNEISVLSEEDLDTWRTADGKNQFNFNGLWLRFEVFSPYLQRVSPQAAAGNDWIDVKNAILDPAIEVTFYPIYSLDQTVDYIIVPVADRNVELFKTVRSMGDPIANLKFITTDQLSEIPSWLRTTKYRG